MTREEFGNMLREHRERKNISINKMAKLVSSSPIDVQRMERGMFNFALDSSLSYIRKCGYMLCLVSPEHRFCINTVEDFLNFMESVRKFNGVTWYAINKSIGLATGTLKAIINRHRVPSIDKALAFIDYSQYSIMLDELSDAEQDFVDQKIEEEKQEIEMPLFIFGHSSTYGGNHRYVTCTDPKLGFIGVVTFYDHMPSRSIGGIILNFKGTYTKFQLAKKFYPEASMKDIKKLMRQCIDEHPVFFQPT